MKPTALPVAMACFALIVLRTAAADTATDAAAANAAIASSTPESPAAAFERMLAPRTPAPAPVAGTPTDVLTHAFNVVLWTEPPMPQMSAQVRHTWNAR